MEDREEDLEGEKSGGGAMSLERAISAVRKRLKLVIAIPVVLAVTSALITLSLPNRYDASALVQIDPRQKLISNMDSVVTDLKGDVPTVESEVEVIRSRPVILSVIETLGLRNDPEFNRASKLEELFSWLGLAKEDASANPDRPAQLARDQIAEVLNPQRPGTSVPERDEVAVAFAERLKVVRVRTTLLIDIRFSASDATKAALIANTIAETYLRQQIEVKRRANAAATEILEAKIEKMRGKVTEAERNVEQWKARNNIFDSEGQILSEKQLARLMEQSVNARNATTEAKAKYEQAQKLARMGDNGTALAEVLKSPTVQALKDQLATANRKAAELATRYGPKHPEMIKIRAEVAEAHAQLDAEIARLVENLKNDYEVADAHERHLAQSIAQMKEQQIDTKDASVELLELQREADSSKQMFEALLTRYKQTSGTQDFQLPDAHIVERADIPLFPASPKRKQIVILATIAGFVMSMGFAVLLELMAPGVSRPEDVKRALAYEHLSSIPAIRGEGDDNVSAEKAVRLIVADPASIYADAIRGARRELDARRRMPGPRVILVASALPNEGAETIASNLAHHYALTGTRVLLADVDARRQPLTRQLAPQRMMGFADQLIMNRPVEAAVLRDGLTGLHFLPAAGDAPLSRSVPEILASPITAAALARLKTRFEVIVLSAPPLLPVSDGRILADYADQIVFVMTWQKTPKALAKKALQTLGPNGMKMAGVVLSEVYDDSDRHYLTMLAQASSAPPRRSRSAA
ncbi:MAG: polysaccharide biosynthesis tyrosine autokinase [Hyphomicrobiaceae bacterium]|nr:polysaccharide biosynthesis tyrosine autokinase [Hyphomicrobiaceae bacterium]